MDQWLVANANLNASGYEGAKPVKATLGSDYFLIDPAFMERSNMVSGWRLASHRMGSSDSSLSY